MKPKTSLLPGTITISRPQGGDAFDAPYIQIEVQDESSRIHFVKVNVLLADFAAALTGLSFQACRFELRGAHLVGSIAENKTEVIPTTLLAGLDSTNPATVATILAPYETDGWRGDVSSLLNHYNRVKGGGQRVTFRRHVDAEGRPL